MDVNKYPVFFEVHNLDIDQKDRIEKYFQIRRRSGGGDCGPVEKVRDNIYKIAFHKQKDQQTVLQKRDHVVEIQGGPLTLIMLGSHEPALEASLSTAPSNTPKQRGSSFHEALSPPGGDKHTVQLNTYLQQYLREIPRAQRHLQQQLSSLGCTLQLPLVDGQPVVVVKCSGQAGAEGNEGGDGLEGWRKEVDRLFEEDYLHHFEVEPLKIQKLLLVSICQDDEAGVKVYSETGQGFVVVVGETSQVRARLSDLEVTTQLEGQGFRVNPEKTSTICRLGEAKLRLLGQGLEQEVSRAAPGVRVTRRSPGELAIEGSPAEVLKARDTVSKMESQVEERALELPSLLMAFLRERYSGPRALEGFMGWGRQVEAQLGNTELHLLSLSSDKLAEAEKALRLEFTEEKIHVPSCSSTPRELRSTLEAKVRRSAGKVSVWFGSGSQVHLLGHAEQVRELREEIGEFLIDRAISVERIAVPCQEIADHFLELLERLDLQDPEVEVLPDVVSTSSDLPSVVLQGPSKQVAQLLSRLHPALISLVRESITIDQPGALRYFQGQGKEYLQVVGRAERCVVLLEGQGSFPGVTPSAASFPSPTRSRLEDVPAARYPLPGGLLVEVRQGDITKERADALVNAANEDLDHGGGVAAALSRAGGPEVQRASTALVRQVGKLFAGAVVETVAGDLPCKMLLHAVGPVEGRVGGKERVLLEKTARAALDLAAAMDLQTLAMPCISSGIFGVPVGVCAEAIVTAVKGFSGEQHGMTKVTLIDVSAEAVRAMQEACDRLLGQRETGAEREREREREKGRERESGLDTLPGPSPSPQDNQGDAAPPPARGAAEAWVTVKIIQGSIETQQMDALVCPMLGSDPLSSRVGKALSEAAGPGLKAAFSREAVGPIGPGDKVLVEGLSGLKSGRVFFISCAPWDNNPEGPAAQALKQGIRRVLSSCENLGFGSIAFPVLGTGMVLKFPHIIAARVLLQEIQGHQQTRTSRTPFLIRIVVHPNDTEAFKAFTTAQGALRLRGVTIEAPLNQTPPTPTSATPALTSLSDVTVMVEGVKFQLISGDITTEYTDVIVNTTDFSLQNQTGVSKAILTAAGPSVQAELAQAGKPADHICSTRPGLLPCKEIVHASFWCEAPKISKTCGKILKLCERKGYRSVSFPAVNTGAGGIDSVTVCRAMMGGLVCAVRKLTPKTLCLVRVVILQDNIFQAFRSELASRPLETVVLPLTLKEKAHLVLKKTMKLGSLSSPPSSSSSPSAPSGLSVSPWKPPPAVLVVLGPESQAVTRARRELEAILMKQLERKEVEGKDLRILEEPELRAFQESVRAQAVSLELGQGRPAAARPGVGDNINYVLRGLGEDVLSVYNLLQRGLSGALRRDLDERNEALVAFMVQWSLQGPGDVWNELGLNGNYMLEQAHLEGLVEVEVFGLNREVLSVNLRTNLATDCRTGRVYKMKREESKTLPQHWDPMAEKEVLKKVELSSGSLEYKTVAQGFLTTAGNFTIRKIERLQNFFLWQAYSVCEKRIKAKNGESAVGEKMLYHGTKKDSCASIEMSGFNRSYAHITAFGVGTYFAVKASYSANDRYSPPHDGVKRMYVARVLTGRYTLGNGTMKVTPPRGSDPTDCYDSLVDNQQIPSMFVIFHDDQAYPEYLITFS
ncbi:protein mono-ADP-ribosyltransferase PARP14-like [Osmerus eperlanus]|uniref:protein mono-ADP-ribosyltransferase PARP14-like n=1 Tax=Osmerus eperlanus TaxID=29151 RepID=UPI002E128662